MELTQERLKELLHYDPDTGLFARKTTRGGFPIGSIAGRTQSHGYTYIMVDFKEYPASHLACLYMYGFLPSVCVDHINGNPTDNRISNLRPATLSENQQNTKMYKNNSSGIKGVTWCNRAKKWMGTIQTDRKRKTIGYFDSLDDAAIAMKKARNELHGDFAKHE